MSNHASISEESTSHESFERSTRASRHFQEVRRDLRHILDEVDAMNIWGRKGYASLRDYCEAELGLDPGFLFDEFDTKHTY